MKACTGRVQYMQDIASILSSCKAGWRGEVSDAAGSMSARVKFNFNKKQISDSLLLASYTVHHCVTNSPYFPHKHRLTEGAHLVFRPCCLMA